MPSRRRHAGNNDSLVHHFLVKRYIFLCRAAMDREIVMPREYAWRAIFAMPNDDKPRWHQVYDATYSARLLLQ